MTDRVELTCQGCGRTEKVTPHQATYRYIYIYSFRDLDNGTYEYRLRADSEAPE